MTLNFRTWHVSCPPTVAYLEKLRWNHRAYAASHPNQTGGCSHRQKASKQPKGLQSLILEPKRCRENLKLIWLHFIGVQFPLNPIENHQRKLCCWVVTEPLNLPGCATGGLADLRIRCPTSGLADNSPDSGAWSRGRTKAGKWTRSKGIKPTAPVKNNKNSWPTAAPSTVCLREEADLLNLIGSCTQKRQDQDTKRPKRVEQTLL